MSNISSKQFLKLYEEKCPIGKCECNEGFPYLLGLCDELGLDFEIMVDVISDVENRCDCGFILNYKSEGKAFVDYLDQIIKTSKISSYDFELNLPHFMGINRNWVELRKTKIMFNQYLNGQHYKYPQCCVLAFLIDTMNSNIEKEEALGSESNRERFVFDLKEKLTEEDHDHLRCPECLDEELGGLN